MPDMSDDNPDLPGEARYEMVVPFIVCQSQGGPLDDDAFVLGFQAGQVNQALASASTVGATAVRFPLLRAELVKQLELIAMNRGYPVVTVETYDENTEWVSITFAASSPENQLP